MTAPIGIGWSTPPDVEFPAGGDDDAVASRLHVAGYGGEDFLVPERAKLRTPAFKYRWVSPDQFAYSNKRAPYAPPRPSLWARFKSWAENLFTDPDGDDE